MSKYQLSYDQAKKKESIAAVPVIQDEIKKWEEIKRTATDSYSKKAADARIQALKIKMTSYKKGDPVKEEVENIDEAKNAFNTTKEKWINKIGGNKEEVTKFVKEKVKELEDRYGDNYAAIVGTLKKILTNKYDVSLDEEAQGAVTTGTVGASTMTSDGQEVPAIYGSSHIVASHMGTVSRKGYYPAPKKNKKKKKVREFVEHYFEKE